MHKGSDKKPPQRGGFPSDSGYLNTEQMAVFLGCSPGAVRNMVMRRKIPYRKAGGRLVFIRAEIDQWIQFSEGLTLEQWKDASWHEA